MQNINLTNEYSIKSLSIDECEIVEKLCKKCSDYYLLANGKLSSKEEASEIFMALPPNKDYEDKFILGIYKFGTELVGVIDIVKNFPDCGEWIIGLMLIEPNERGSGLGKAVHNALIQGAAKLGTESFRIGVIEDNHNGIKFWSSLGYTKIKEVKMEFEAKTHIVNVMRLKL